MTPEENKKTTEDKIPQWALDLQNQVSELKNENAMLKDLAGNNTIKSYIDGKEVASSKTAHFKLWKDKIVIGWEKLDYSVFNPKAADGLGENILTTLLFADGSKEQVNYVAFNRATEVVFLEIVKHVGDLSVIKMPDGKELTVETKFLNR